MVFLNGLFLCESLTSKYECTSAIWINSATGKFSEVVNCIRWLVQFCWFLFISQIVFIYKLHNYKNTKEVILLEKVLLFQINVYCNLLLW